jgi:hypothetical protein
LGYFSAGFADSIDWFRVTNTVDGTLAVNVQTDPSSPLTVRLTLYDVDGTLLKDIGCGGTVSVSGWALRPGTYFASVGRCNGAGSYTIGTTLTPSAMSLYTVVKSAPNFPPGSGLKIPPLSRVW